ncbi:TMEM165/GDT1 family protein [Synechocystis sp. PCC 7509]|uniref:TMEM165/GDT1 family protein n=1 Tax=Synechocystis sp. PCC 7509 TaxID=927677 RepID=UPI0002AC968D
MKLDVAPLSANPNSAIAPERHRGSMGAIFGSTFLTIFLAELGDKTQLATLLMSAESQNPWIVFLGASAALVTTSLLGVIVGRWIASRFAPKTIEIAAGISLLLISATLLWDVIKG